MKMFAMTVILLSSLNVFAAGKKGYELKMDLSIDGKHIVSPTLHTEPGEMAKVEQKVSDGRISIEVTTSEDSKVQQGGIHMDFIITKIAKDGTRTTLAKPQIITMDKKTASITTTGEANKQQVDLKVTPTRIRL